MALLRSKIGETGPARMSGRALGLWAGLLAALALAGCATRPPAEDKEAVAAYEDVNDPLEPMNRYFFEVNLFLDKMFLRPAAEIYRGAVPTPVQHGVRNVLNNLDEPLIMVHDLLQGEPERASDSFGRFVTNTFVGLGGIFDPASGDLKEDGTHGIPFHDEDMGQTLAVWGSPSGPYLMLPVLGPSNVRDATGRVADAFLDPVPYAVDKDSRLTFQIVRRGLDALDKRARNIETLDDIERNSIDFYAAIRSLYRQHRAAQISNGQGPRNPMPGVGAMPGMSDLKFDDDSGGVEKADALPSD